MEQEREHEFRTLKGYDLSQSRPITYAMEDYLEMICRSCGENGFVRISNLSEQLHVKPSSTSKMMGHLKECGLVDYEKYGLVSPTQQGWELGQYLLHRHEVLNRFFCLINHTEEELEQTEQIEHFMNRRTVDSIERLILQLESQGNEKTACEE